MATTAMKRDRLSLELSPIVPTSFPFDALTARKTIGNLAVMPDFVVDFF